MLRKPLAWGLVAGVIFVCLFSGIFLTQFSNQNQMENTPPPKSSGAPTEANSTIILTNYTSLNGLTIKVEYQSDSDDSTPIVLMAPGLGGSMNYTATLQRDIAKKGYVTVGFSEPVSTNSNRFVQKEKADIDSLLNWTVAGNVGVGNSSNVCLLGQSAGGNAALTFCADDRVNAVLAVCPAYFGVPIPSNTKFTAVIVGQKDMEYRSNGCTLYSQLVSPKWFCSIRNGTHALGITDKVEALPTNYTRLVESYILGCLDYSLKADRDALAYLTVNSISDGNLSSATWKLPDTPQ